MFANGRVVLLVLLFGLLASMMIGCNSSGGGGDDGGPGDEGGTDIVVDEGGTDIVVDESLYLQPAPGKEALDQLHGEFMAVYEARVDADLRSSIATHISENAATGLSLRNAASDAWIDAWIKIGVEAFIYGDLHTASWCFFKAYDEDPENIDVLAHVGFVLVYQGEVEQGRQFLLQAYAVDSHYHIVLLSLGYSYEVAGDFDRAIFYYNQVMVDHPENLYFYYPLGRAYLGAGRYEVARTLLTHASNAFPALTDIKTTLDSVPEGESEDEVEPDPEGGSSGGIGGTQMMTDLNTCSMNWLNNQAEAVAPIGGFGGSMMQVDQDVQNEFGDSNDTMVDCETACALQYPMGSDQDNCIMNCLSAWCSRDRAILESGSRRYTAAYYEWQNADAGALHTYEMCAFTAYYKHLAATPKMFHKPVRSGIWDVLLTGVKGWSVVWQDDVEVTIGAFRDHVASTCDSATSTIADITLDNLLYGEAVSGDIGKMCGQGICFEWNGTDVKVDVNVGGWSFNLSGSYFKGFTGTFGKQIWSNNNAEVNMMTRFNSRTDSSSVDFTGKVTGPITNQSIEQRMSVASF